MVAKKIVVEVLSNEFSEETLKKKLREDRFLPEQNNTFIVNTWNLVLKNVQPPKAKVTSDNTKIELIENINENGVKENVKGKSVFNFLNKDLLGSKQEMALKIIDTELKGEEKPTPPVFFFQGPPSTSKTKILNAIKHAAESWNKNVAYHTGPKLTKRYVGQTSNELEDIKNKVGEDFILLIDEVDSIVGRRRVENNSTHLFEAVTSMNLLLDQIIEKNSLAVLASNVEELNIDPAILNRSLMIKRGSPSKQEVKKAIEIFGEEFNLSDEIIKRLLGEELKDFREARKLIQMIACGIDIDRVLELRDNNDKKSLTYIE